MLSNAVYLTFVLRTANFCEQKFKINYLSIYTQVNNLFTELKIMIIIICIISFNLQHDTGEGRVRVSSIHVSHLGAPN
jgi:hypothetical protein